MTYLENQLQRPASSTRVLDIDVVIPVKNEEKTIVQTVETVLAHLAELPYRSQVTIADNASTDDTAMLGRLLAERFTKVRYEHLPQAGRGLALKHAWSTSQASVLVYMDVDLSTDLSALLPLVAPLLSGHSDIAIGTRLSPDSRTVRGTKRELISRTYNFLLQRTLRARFSDAQCGFKAIRAEVARDLIPLIEDDSWFFDTEMLVLAEHAGLRIHEVPVDWVDDPQSTVDVAKTVRDDLSGMWRVGAGLASGRISLDSVRKQARWAGHATENSPDLPADSGGGLPVQVVIFAIVGVCSTIAYALLFVLFQPLLGAQWANFVSLVLTALANTAANRRFTFGITDPTSRGRHHLQGLLVFAAGLSITSASLFLLHSSQPNASPLTEMVVLTLANLFVTAVRFAAMRWWIFKSS
ncbi:MAG TPA: glycosyltransferase [Aeromicrobium sp.]|nr:glycosyltransferase [Aeromicrobium sp.]